MAPVRIGTSETDFWLYSPEDGYDLSRGAGAVSSSSIETNKGAVKVSKSLSALVIIDMQNIFLHPEMRNHERGLAALPRIVEAVAASRKAGVKVLWVNWGLTEEEISDMAPSLAAGFTAPLPAASKAQKMWGADIGMEVDGVLAGKLLVKDQWNVKLYSPLQALYEEGAKLGTDVWIDKNRLGALHTYDTDFGKYLQSNGLRTLFFTGVNTDNCVSGTFNDCYSKGYDCLLINDGTGTSAPDAGQAVTERISGNYGFTTSTAQYCSGLAR